MPTRRRRAAAAVIAAVLAATLGACATGAASDAPIRVGWTPELPPLDPVVSDDAGAFSFLSLVHPTLFAIDPREGRPVPDLAESGEFTEDGDFKVVLKPGLRFANGDELTASDVQFSIERQRALMRDGGPWRRLDALERIEVVDARTLVFHLKTASDASFPFVLAGPAGFVLDEEVFFADEVTPDGDLITAGAFGGPYTLEPIGDGLLLEPYEDYRGVRASVSTLEVYAGEPADMATRIHDGGIDVLTGRFDVETLERLAGDDMLRMVRAESGRVRLLSFDLVSMPFGVRAEDADDAKATALRFAIADVIDRRALVHAVGANWVAPIAGYIPDGVPGAGDPLEGLWGDGRGGPDAERAAQRLESAGIEPPVQIGVVVVPGIAGGPVVEEAAEIADQLEASGLFIVDLDQMDAEAFARARARGEVPIAFATLGSPIGDPQDYLSPFRTGGALVPGFSDADVDRLLAEQRTAADPAARIALFERLQTAIGAKLPAIPVSQGVRVVFARASIQPPALVDSLPFDLGSLRR